jgi:hypothetical protein
MSGGRSSSRTTRGLINKSTTPFRRVIHDIKAFHNHLVVGGGVVGVLLLYVISFLIFSQPRKGGWSESVGGYHEKEAGLGLEGQRQNVKDRSLSMASLIRFISDVMEIRK